MKKLLLLFLPLVATFADDPEFLMALGDGRIQPPGVVATKADVAVLTGIAQSARGDAITAQNTVEAALDYLSDLAATSNQFGFVNGSILSFGKQNFGADTNAWGVMPVTDARLAVKRYEVRHHRPSREGKQQHGARHRWRRHGVGRQRRRGHANQHADADQRHQAGGRRRCRWEFRRNRKRETGRQHP